MKSLSNFINESTAGAFITVLSRDEAKNVLTGRNLDEFIDIVYDLWESDFSKIEKYPPFRTNGKEIKIAWVYQSAHKLFDALDAAGIAYKNETKYMKVNNYSFKWGNGSPAGHTASSAGLEYEVVVLDNLKAAITSLAAGVDPKEVFTDKENLKPIYDAGDLDAAVDYIKKNPLDIDKVVISTGKISTARNKSGQIFDKNLELNTANKRKSIKESGVIISDVQVVVPGKEPVNISVKLKKAQLSAPQVSDVMQTNKGFNIAVDAKLPYSDIKDEQYMIKFNNMCKLLGADPEDIYNWYIGNRETSGRFKAHNSDLIGDMFSFILGGDYWYVTPNPADTTYVPWDCDYDACIDTSKPIEISASGKQIKATVKIAGISGGAHIAFRSDQKYYEYPVRFFFDGIHVADVIKAVK